MSAFKDIPGAVVELEQHENLRVIVPYDHFPEVHALLKEGGWRVIRSGPATVSGPPHNHVDSSRYEVHAWRLQQPSTSAVKMCYIGACSLLGRISGARLTEDENDLVRDALEDCAKLYPSLEVWSTGTGGSALNVKVST